MSSDSVVDWNPEVTVCELPLMPVALPSISRPGDRAGVFNLPVLANAKTDKPKHQQDGSGYHYPIRIFHR